MQNGKLIPELFFRIRHFPLITAFILIALTGLLIVTLTHSLALDDSLRHLAMARLLHAQGIAQAPGWDAFFHAGIMQQLHVDPWFLFHLLLTPLAALPIYHALDWMTFGCSAAVILSFWWLLRSQKISPQLAAGLILLLVLGEVSFTNRLLLARPFLLITAITLVLLRCILEKRVLLIGICLLLAVLLSQLFIFPLFIVGCGVVWLCTQQEWKRGGCIAIAAALGVLLGWLVHPHSADYLTYFITVFFKITGRDTASLGQEMHSGFGRFLPFVEVFLAGSLLSLLHAYKSKKISVQDMQKTGITLVLVLIAVFFFLFIKWRRSLDFLWPLSLLLFAQIHALHPTALIDALKQFSKTSKQRKLTLLALLASFALLAFFPRLLDFLWPILTLLLFAIFHSLDHRPIRLITSGLCCLVFAQLMLWTYPFDAARSLVPFAGMLRIPTAGRVVNMDWQSFPMLVSLRPDLTYAHGIDHTFLKLTHPNILHSFDVLTNLEHSALPPGAQIDVERWLADVQKQMPAEYLVLSTQSHPRLIQALESSSARLMTKNKTLSIFSF